MHIQEVCEFNDGEAVCAMQPGTGTFADGVKTLDAGGAVDIGFDSSANEVSGGHYGDQVMCHIDTCFHTFGKDVGEASAQSFFAVMPDIEIDALFAGAFHFRIDGAGDHIAGREAFHRMVFVHEFDGFCAVLFAAFQNRPLAAESFTDEK